MKQTLLLIAATLAVTLAEGSAHAENDQQIPTKEEIAKLQSASDNGNAMAQFQLGWLCRRGCGGTRCRAGLRRHFPQCPCSACKVAIAAGSCGRFSVEIPMPNGYKRLEMDIFLLLDMKWIQMGKIGYYPWSRSTTSS